MPAAAYRKDSSNEDPFSARIVGNPLAGRANCFMPGAQFLRNIEGSLDSLLAAEGALRGLN